MSTVTAAWPAPDLVSALARSAWGELDGRPLAGVRDVLRALVDLLPYGAAEGALTASQVADASGLSLRWVRTCMHRLEAAGLITWRRGWLKAGRPQAGWVRVSKTRLAAMIRAAREADVRTTRRRERATALAARLATLRNPTQRPKRHKPLSRRWELSSPLNPLRGEVPTDLTRQNTTKGTTTMDAPTPMLCPHGFARRSSCSSCSPAPARGTHTAGGVLDHSPAAKPAPTAGVPCATCGQMPTRCGQLNSLAPWSARHTYTPATPRRRP